MNLLLEYLDVISWFDCCGCSCGWVWLLIVLVGLLWMVGVIVDVCRGRMAGRDGLVGNAGGCVDDEMLDGGNGGGGGDALFNDLLNNAALLA